MELLELFTGRKKKLARGHLKNLIEVAYSDGEFDSVEVDYLLSLAGRFNISEAELKNIKDNPDTIEYEPPTRDQQRFEHLYQLVNMMMIDGVIHDKEIDICKKYAQRLNLRPEFVDDMVEAIPESREKELPTDAVISRLLKLAQDRK
uniref:TerB family tellurite resistance protein n=1 Tax=Roseihalotalea indica TaxID=2867963 RepID=A0AA49JCP9_9BACT|nr:TerB family tellurite resistance protein [Tunicatimonas sp. TK19036]